MKNLFFLFAVLFVSFSCEKDLMSPYESKINTTEQVLLLDDNEHTYQVNEVQSTINESFNYLISNDTLLVEYFTCDVPCTIIPGAAPQETAIGAKWVNGDFSTIGIFNWIMNNNTIVCADNIMFEGKEVFVYVNGGDGVFTNIDWQQLNNSDVISVDTIFRSDIFNGYYLSDTTKQAFRFYGDNGSDIRIRFDSFELIR